MATVSSAIQLYGVMSSLAFTLTQMANTPLNPFSNSSSTKLRLESQGLISCANALHNKDAASLMQPAVDSAIQHVNAAQAIFDVINNNPTNTFTDVGVFAVVDSAISAAQAAISLTAVALTAVSISVASSVAPSPA